MSAIHNHKHKKLMKIMIILKLFLDGCSLRL